MEHGDFHGKLCAGRPAGVGAPDEHTSECTEAET